MTKLKDALVAWDTHPTGGDFAKTLSARAKLLEQIIAAARAAVKSLEEERKFTDAMINAIGEIDAQAAIAKWRREHE